VNWHHFGTFLWLRWRLFINQMRRGGIANVVILGALAFLALCLAAGGFLSLLLVGLFVLPNVPAQVILYVWDGLLVGFVFFWMIGLLVELQRAEALSLDRFLHMPVSLRGAFIINYLSSLLNLTLVVFLPPMVGLALALVVARGPALLLQFPLLAAFVLMVTAVTYQFQGWLASLMANPRRRRSVIVGVTIGFILLCQLPNLVNIMRPWENIQRQETERLSAEEAELRRAQAAQEIDAEEFRRRMDQAQRESLQRTDESLRRTVSVMEETGRVLNLALPPAWLALGSAAAAEGNLLTALLCLLGMTAIGTASLWRAYRTTVRLYTGQFSSGKRRKVVAAAPARPGPQPVVLVERRLPWLSERASVIALCSFRSLLRAPEAKMMLLTPVLMALIFGGLFLMRSVDLPLAIRPLVVFGAIAMTLISTGQLAGNQFGFDRSGFRVYVLSAAPRRDVLLGKNAAFALLTLALVVVQVVVVEVAQPLRVEHLLSAPPQFVCMFLSFCLVANFLSIFAPVPIRAGSAKPVNLKAVPILLNLAFAFLSPLILLPALLPLGIEVGLEELGWVQGLPVCLVLSLAECALVIYLYRLAVNWQGDLLQAREQKILETVTTRAE
jgi:hypothetical protein